jgi:hypothetical protein
LNKSLLKILIGDYEEGWKLYEWRWKKDTLDALPPVTNKQQWKFGDQSNRLLIWGEQGVGDQIFFGGLIPEMSNLVQETLVKIDSRLIPVFSRSMPGIQFFPNEQDVAEDIYDTHIPMGSLGGHLRNSLDDFKKTKNRYLMSDSNRTDRLHNELSHNGNLICGISWKSKNEKTGSNTRLSLKNLSSIFSEKNVTLVNLQYGDVKDEIENLKLQDNIEVLQCSSVDNFNDLDGLASLIDACDLVVSVDNITVALSCALGKPSWILLPFAPNCRWMIDRTDSPWYPSATLFRQPVIGDWDSVISELATKLQTWLK